MVLTNCFTFQNPNLRPQRQKKVTELNTASSSKTQLTRREREEIEKQKAKAKQKATKTRALYIQTPDQPH